MRRNAELKNLHPLMRAKVQELTERMRAVGNPLTLFEGYRSPERQQYLYSIGRTAEMHRSPVTRAQAWSSYHQYGVACDFVLYIDGKWSWKTSGKFKAYWDQLHEFGQAVGLKPLSWEKPHLQIHNINLQSLQAGRYPPDGDESWAENLYEAIQNWRQSPTPPLPKIEIERPDLKDDATDEEQPIQMSPQYRVTARSGLRMRAGPGTSFEIVSVLSVNQIVSTMSKHGDWYQVDLHADGLADGYCHSGFLQALNETKAPIGKQK